MRRYTLCKCCLAVLAILFFMHIVGIAAKTGCDESPGGETFLSGIVCDIQQKETEYHQIQTLISLKNVALYDSAVDPPEPERDEHTRMSGGVLCYLKSDQEQPLMGERVTMLGELQEFSQATNPGCFDQKRYQAARGLSLCMKKAELIERGSTYSGYRQFLYRVREYLGSIIDATCTESDAGVINAMLLGDKTELDSAQKKLYQENGIAHIRGLNFSMRPKNPVFKPFLTSDTFPTCKPA